MLVEVISEIEAAVLVFGYRILIFIMVVSSMVNSGLMFSLAYMWIFNPTPD